MKYSPLHWLLTMINVNHLSSQKFDKTRKSFNTTVKETLTGFDRWGAKCILYSSIIPEKAQKFIESSLMIEKLPFFLYVKFEIYWCCSHQII